MIPRLRCAIENSSCPRGRGERPRRPEGRFHGPDFCEIGDQMRAHGLCGPVQDVCRCNGRETTAALGTKTVGRNDEPIFIPDRKVVMGQLHDTLCVGGDDVALRVETRWLCQINLIGQPKDRITIIACALRVYERPVCVSRLDLVVVGGRSFQPDPELLASAPHPIERIRKRKNCGRIAQCDRTRRNVDKLPRPATSAKPVR